MALPADFVDLPQNGTAYVLSGENAKVHLRKNGTGAITHAQLDNNFELLRAKVNEVGGGNNALKQIYGDTVSAATSATNAATSATNAATSASNAATSATNASTSESNASTSGRA